MGIKSKEQELPCSENPLEGKIYFNQKPGMYEISVYSRKIILWLQTIIK